MEKRAAAHSRRRAWHGARPPARRLRGAKLDARRAAARRRRQGGVVPERRADRDRRLRLARARRSLQVVLARLGRGSALLPAGIRRRPPRGRHPECRRRARRAGGALSRADPRRLQGRRGPALRAAPPCRAGGGAGARRDLGGPLHRAVGYPLPQRLRQPARPPRRAAQRAAQPPPGAAGALGAIPGHRRARAGARRRMEFNGLNGKERKMGKLEGKVAVITGGNSGIGLATAIEFVEQGAQLVISGRDQKTLDQAAKELGPEVLVVRADVSKLADIDRLFAAVKAKFGRIDVLFVNAGIGKFAPFEAVTEELYDAILDVNLKGAYFTIQKALPLLADGASIVLNASINAHIGMPNSSVYAASKAALLSLARTLSAELVGRNIRVNAISPGPVTTPIFGRLGLGAEALEQTLQRIASQVPMKRFGRPEEI